MEELGLAGIGRGGIARARFRLRNREKLISLGRSDFLLRSIGPLNFELVDLVACAEAECGDQLRLRQVAVRGGNDALLNDAACVQAEGRTLCLWIAAATDELHAQPVMAKLLIV